MVALRIILFVSVSNASDMSFTDVFMSNQSAGVIYPFIKYLKTAESLCENNARGLYKSWIDRNKTLVDRLKVSQQRYYKKVAKESGKSVAMQVKEDQDSAVEDTVALLLHMLNLKPVEKRKSYCKTLNMEIIRGEWDIKEKYPDIYSFLINLKP